MTKRKTHSTTSIGTSIFGIIIWILFIWAWILAILHIEDDERRIGLLVGWIWLLFTILCCKALIKSIKKRKIKKHKDRMTCVIATVSRFDRFEVSRTTRNVWPQLSIGNMSFGKTEVNIQYAYYFTATKWDTEYESDDFSEKKAKIVGFNWNIWELFSLYHIMYNPASREANLETIKRAIEELEIEIQNAGFLKKPVLQAKLAQLSEIKANLEVWDPYMEINGHSVKIWDTVNVYIDPENPESYWVDTDYLYNK